MSKLHCHREERLPETPEVGDLRRGLLLVTLKAGPQALDMCAGSGGALEDYKLLPCSFTMDPTAPLPPKVPPLIFCCFL